MRSTPSPGFLLTFLCIILAGCQGSQPVIPAASPDPAGQPEAVSNGPVHQCLGFWTLQIDKNEMSARMLPVRTLSLHVNVTGVLNTTMGVSAATVPGQSDPQNGLFVLDVTLTHPFPTKPQLAGFDVRGILITPGSLSVGSLRFADIKETRLENADGYTRWWNPTEFTTPGMFGYTQGTLAKTPAAQLTATVNPYKLFADLLDATGEVKFVKAEPIDSPDGRAVFKAGEANTRRYTIRFPVNPAPVVKYGYAVDASWAAPVPNPPVNIPSDFPINANSPEPWLMTIVPFWNTLYYDSEAAFGGGVLKLIIGISDWQGQVAGNIKDQISAVKVFSPGLFSGSVDAVYSYQDPKTAFYEADLTGIAIPKSAGPVLIICAAGSTDGSTYKQTAAQAPNQPLAAFNATVLNVPDPDCTGDANNDWTDAMNLLMGVHIADQVCVPDDYKDYYRFEVPLGSIITGGASLYCDANPCQLELYDSSKTPLAQVNVIDGYAAISLGMMQLDPDLYYLRVFTSDTSHVAPYLLDLDTELVSVTPSSVTDVTPPDLFVKPFHVWMHDHYAYLVGVGYWVFDYTSLNNPVNVSGGLLGTVWSKPPADFSYPYCYYIRNLSGGPPNSQIDLIDFSSPSQPVVQQGTVTTGPAASALCMSSTHLYVATKTLPSNTVTVYSYTSNPSAPSVQGSFGVSGEIKVMDLIDPEGAAVFLVVGTKDTLYVFNVENPSSADLVGSMALPLNCVPHEITVHNNLIYVLDSDGTDTYLDIFLFNNPGLSPNGYKKLTGTGNDIAIKWPYAYIADGPTGLVICDVSIVFPPTVSTISLPDEARGVAVDSDGVYVIPRNGSLFAYSTSGDPASPVFESRVPAINMPSTDIIFFQQYAIVGDESPPAAVEVIDISDPDHAKIAAEHIVTVLPRRICMYGNYLAAGGGDSVIIMNAAIPLNMSILGTYSAPGITIRQLAMHKSALYVMYEDPPKVKVKVVSLSDPSAPVEYTSFSYDAASAKKPVFYQEFMYVPAGNEIRIYSVSVPHSPAYAGSYTAANYIDEIEIRGHYMYILMGGASLIEIVDLSSPANPVHAGSTAFSAWSTQNLAVDGQLAYFSGNNPAIFACWIYPPDSPSEYGVVYPDKWAGGSLDANWGYLYKVTLGTGLRMFDLY